MLFILYSFNKKKGFIKLCTLKILFDLLLPNKFNFDHQLGTLNNTCVKVVNTYVKYIVSET